jgi:transcriptional regulator
MLQHDIYAITDPEQVRALVDEHGWATLISCRDGGPLVSHLPVVPDPAGGLSILGHLARADAELHGLGAHDVVLVIEGPNGYVSPGVYQDGPYVPTWDFVVAHLYGRPVLLDADETYRVLELTVEHFERNRPEPWQLHTVDDYAHSLAPYTSGFRLVPSRFVAKQKLSQDKPEAVIRRVIDAFAGAGIDHNPALARAIEQAVVRA